MAEIVITAHMKRLIKLMTDHKARIHEVRHDEQSHYYLLRDSYDGKHWIYMSEISEGVIRKLQAALLIKSMDVGYYNWKSQKWTDPAEIFDLPLRWDEYAEMRETMKREARQRLAKGADEE